MSLIIDFIILPHNASQADRSVVSWFIFTPFL